MVSERAKFKRGGKEASIVGGRVTCGGADAAAGQRGAAWQPVRRVWLMASRTLLSLVGGVHVHLRFDELRAVLLAGEHDVGQLGVLHARATYEPRSGTHTEVAKAAELAVRRGRAGRAAPEET